MIRELRFVIADIDGTLVNEKREMLPLTRKILEDLHRRGVYVGIASGRPLGPQIYNIARTAWQMSFMPDCFIGMNGGQLKDDLRGTYSEFYKLSEDAIREILCVMEQSGISCNPFIYIGEDMLSRYIDDLMYSSMKRHGISCETVKDLSDFWKEPTGKMLFRLNTPDDMPKLEAYLSGFRDRSWAFFKTQPTMMEFQDPRVTKAVAMKSFCEANEIPIDTVMAFGDMTNDNDMLKEAGWSICLKNGSDDTKACADVITEEDNDHDGFGNYLLKHWYEPNGWTLE